MAIELFTYDDAVQHLVDTIDFNDATRLGRAARRAVDNAYRDLPNMTRWTYYVRRTTLKTSASQSSSTVTYDHTGGASERMVTLASGTWPSWARFGVIRIDSVDYRVATRESDMVITLFEEDNPGEDVDSGETYTLWRNAYPLPLDFRKLMSLVDVDQHLELPIVSPGEWQRRRAVLQDNPGVPWSAAIFGDGDYYGQLQIVFEPPPNTVRNYDLLYEAKGRDLNTVSYSTGTVTTSGTTATFSAATPTYILPGAVVRFSADDTAVTNKYGSNPFIEQRVLSSQTSAAVWELDQALTTDATADAFQISDPIDFENVAMQTAFLRAIEAECAQLLRLKDVDSRMQLAQYHYRLATANDRRSVTAGPSGNVSRRWRDLPVTTD